MGAYKFLRAKSDEHFTNHGPNNAFSIFIRCTQKCCTKRLFLPMLLKLTITTSDKLDESQRIDFFFFQKRG